ncbi:MAG: dephospho-CoA kinase [bacterium]|nr:dephospho-CoA kinase [bacterium]
MGRTWVLTGPMGCGKSTVAKMLTECGAACLDADALSNRVLARHEDVHRELADMFGSEVFGDDGRPRRDYIGDMVFKQPQLLSDLEALLHPYVFEEMREATGDWHARNHGLLFLEVVLWFQQRAEPFPVDGVLMLWAPHDVLIERVTRRSKLSESQVAARLAAQGNWDDLNSRADRVLNTDCDLDTLRQHVRTLYRIMRVD